ncbi:MAG: type II toxin-antitoxin system Phd/YefM family antitoxin [Synechocystis sp.]|nr:type II toxin-antitoxin system Phd/YefM family antitoxin [Synechocystis sp.]
MTSITFQQFANNLKDLVKQVIVNHDLLKITNQNGEEFMVVSAEDWEQQQETLYVLQNQNLMAQINDSVTTHQQNQGYSPKKEELNEILSVGG